MGQLADERNNLPIDYLSHTKYDAIRTQYDHIVLQLRGGLVNAVSHVRLCRESYCSSYSAVLSLRGSSHY